MSVKQADGVVAENYFISYEDLQVHRLMLGDEARMDAYKKAILTNKCAFEGRVVMDVGAGTGILSLLCASAGAKKVYAVEASDLATLTSDVVEENGYSDIIEVMHQRVEDVCLPDDVKVDIIVSEWMGFYLLHESMLDSVIVARDKFLKADGKFFPDKAHLYAAPCCVPSSLWIQLQEDKNFWADVCGFQMNCVGRMVLQERSKTPEVSTLVSEGDLLSNGTNLLTLDLYKVSISDLDCIQSRKFISVNRDAEYGGVCIWFECEFPNLSDLSCKPKSDCDIGTPQQKVNEKIILSTSPCCPPTHWKQTLILWPPEVISASIADDTKPDGSDSDCKDNKNGSSTDSPCKWLVEDGEVIGFNIILRRDPTCPRRYGIQLEALDPSEEEHPIPCECGTARCTIIGLLQQSEVSSQSSFSSDGECDVDDM